MYVCMYVCTLLRLAGWLAGCFVSAINRSGWMFGDDGHGNVGNIDSPLYVSVASSVIQLAFGVVLIFIVRAHKSRLKQQQQHQPAQRQPRTTSQKHAKLLDRGEVRELEDPLLGSG